MCIKKMEENIKEKHIRNAYKEDGTLKGDFKPPYILMQRHK
jgi:hypothetical protein